jgi:hypothetical protein
MVEEVSTSETSVNFPQTSWRNKLADGHLLDSVSCKIINNSANFDLETPDIFGNDIMRYYFF